MAMSGHGGSNGKTNGKADGSVSEQDALARTGARGAGAVSVGDEDEKGPDSSKDDLAAGGSPVEVADESPDPLAPMPPAVADLVAACVRFVATRYGVPLDFTQDTLSLVDQYARDGRRELSVRPEGVDLLAGSIGAYLGEVIRREHGGYWVADGDPSAWRVQLSRVFLSFNPIGMAREALTLEEAEGFGAHLQLDEAERDAVEARLAALPEVDEEEFFLPTTRFDIVQIAVHALRAIMQSNGLADVRFTPEDY